MKHNGSHIDKTYSAMQAIHYSPYSDRSSPAVRRRDSIPSPYSAGTWFESRQGPPSVIEGYSKILSVTPLFSKINPQILYYSFCDVIIWGHADTCHFYSVSNLFTITHNFWYLIILSMTTDTLQPGSDSNFSNICTWYLYPNMKFTSSSLGSRSWSTSLLIHSSTKITLLSLYMLHKQFNCHNSGHYP